MSTNLDFIDGSSIELGTMYCIGKNYAKHAEEMGGKVPSEPIVFIKPPSAYVPDGGTIIIPDYSKDVHHEVELVVLIGKDCNNISRIDAKDVIAGYAVGVDVTLRDLQAQAKKNGEPWAIAKGFYTSAPISRFIPAALFNGIPDFDISISVNGETRQKGNTCMMERSVGVLIEYLSKVFTLRRGDLIFTGTPEGVSQIKSGDKIVAELDGFISLYLVCK